MGNDTARRVYIVAIAVLLLVAGTIRACAQDRPVTLQLNQVGADGLARMLDIARRNAPTMNDADMAVSLYHALERARDNDVAAAARDAQKLTDSADLNAAKAKSDSELKARQDEIEKLKAEVERLKKPSPQPEWHDDNKVIAPAPLAPPSPEPFK